MSTEQAAEKVDPAVVVVEQTSSPEVAAEPPVTPAAADVAVADKPEKLAEESEPAFDKEAWGTTNDETGDGVLQMLHDAGVTPEVGRELLLAAAESGDVSKIDRAALIAAVGKARATLIVAGVENFTARRAAAAADLVKLVHEAAGGADAWAKVQPWAASLPEAERAVLNKMLDAGGIEASIAVKTLVDKFNADPKNVRLNSKEVRGDGVSTAKPAVMSQRAWGDRLSLLHKTRAPAEQIEKERAAYHAARRA